MGFQKRKVVFLSLFFMCICLPLFFFVSGVKAPIENISEKRKLAKMPTLSELSPKRIESYINDHFPFRSQFIGEYMRTWELVLGASVRKSFKGKDGHYFPQWSNAKVIDAYMGIKPLSKQQLDLLYLTVLGKKLFWNAA